MQNAAKTCHGQCFPKIGSQCNKLAMVNIPWRKGKNEQVHRVWAKVPQEITLIFWNGLYLSLEII